MMIYNFLMIHITLKYNDNVTNFLKVGKTSNKWNKMEFAKKSQIPENEKIKKRGFKVWKIIML